MPKSVSRRRNKKVRYNPLGLSVSRKSAANTTEIKEPLSPKGAKPTYEITKIDVNESSIPQCPAAMDGVLPEHPFRMYVVGASGSGKSNFVLNLLTKPHMYKDYFDDILVISPTAAHLDPNYRMLQLPKENFFDPDEEVLERIMEIQEDRVLELGRSKAPKILLLLDDVISYKSFVNSPIVLKFAVMSRHWNISLMILSQAYHRIPKSVRMQMTSIVFFKGSNKELIVLAEDFSAPGMSHGNFIAGICYATHKRYNFFFVDLNRQIENGRYRKNLNEHMFTNYEHPQTVKKSTSLFPQKSIGHVHDKGSSNSPHGVLHQPGHVYDES